MRRRQFAPQVDGLENRVVLSTVRGIRPAALRAVSARLESTPPITAKSTVPIDTTIPFVLAPEGVNQNAINFTSHTYYQVVSGRGAGKDGLSRLFSRFNSSEDLASGLSALSFRVPYGNTELLPIWLDTLDAGGGESDLRADLQTYVNDGVGVFWNTLKSVQRHSSTDGDLVYNGKVGRNS